MPDDEGLREPVCTCGHDLEYHGNADGQTGWQTRCGHPDCECDDFEEGCSDVCRRMICEWCPEYDRQAAIVEEFRASVDRADALTADGTEPRPAHRQDETEAGRG